MMTKLMSDAVICVSTLVIHKNPEYNNFFKEKGIKVLVLDSAGEIAYKLKEGYTDFYGVEELFLFNNVLEIFTKVDEWRKEFNIIGVINFKEAFVEEANLIKKMTNCLGPGDLASTICSNKNLQRQFLKSFSPQSFKIKLSNYVKGVTDYSFPVVIKPIKGSSSENVILVKGKEDFTLIPPEIINCDVLIEEYIIGREFSVESLIFDGEIIFVGVTEKITTEGEGNYFAELGHTVPAVNISSEERDSLLYANKEILRILEFEYGIAHAEYKITPDGNIKLMEVACRPPGDGIVDLYSRSYRINFPEMILKCLLGDRSIISDVQEVRRWVYSRQRYFEHPFGILEDIETSLSKVWFYEVDLDMYNRYCKMKFEEPYIYIYRQKGDELSNIKNSYDRSASIIYSCNDYGKLSNEFTVLTNDINYKIRDIEDEKK